MLKVLFGEEPYLIDRLVDQMADGLDEMNIARFETLDDQVFQAAQQFPFLAKRQLIIADVPKLACESLCKVSIPEFTDLVVLAGEVDKRTSLYKKLNKKGCLEEVKKMDLPSLKTFITDQLAEHGGRMDEGVLDFFIRHIGYLTDEHISLYTVVTAIQQLTFAASVIKKEDVEALVEKSIDVKMWQLSGLLLNLDKKALFSMANHLLDEKESVIGMLSMILRTFRLAYKASLYKGEKSSVIAKELGVPAFQYQAAMRFRPEQISGCLDKLQGGVNEVKDGAPERVVFFSTLGQVLLQLGGAV